MRGCDNVNIVNTRTGQSTTKCRMSELSATTVGAVSAMWQAIILVFGISQGKLVKPRTGSWVRGLAAAQHQDT